MSCLTSTKRARILAQITKLESQLEITNDALDSALSTDVKEYRIDTGEGSQRVEYKSPSELRQNIDWIESRLDYLYRRLNGSGLSNLNLRRKQYNRVY